MRRPGSARRVLFSQRIDDWQAPPAIKLGEDRYDVPVPIPLSAAVGPARYIVVASFSCGIVDRWFRPLVGPVIETPFVIATRPSE